MKTGLQDIFDLINGLRGELWHRRWIGMLVAWPVAAVCAVVVSLMSDRYQADAKVYVDTQTVLKPLMSGLAVQPDMDQQVRMLARTLVSRPNVERLMNTPEIGFDPILPVNREAAITGLMTKIKIEPTGGNLYSINYRDVNPDRAKRLVENLVKLFMSSSSMGQKQDSQEAAKFINAQIAEHETKLVAAENRLKEFKLKNFGISGVSNQDYFARMSALAEQVSKLETDLRAAENSRDAYQRQLVSETSRLPTAEPDMAPAAPRSEVEVRLGAQKAQLDDLMRRFTEEHPDVVSVKRNIAMLEAQRRQEQEAQARAISRGQGAAVTSAVYQQIRMALTQAEADIASLRSRLGAEQGRLAEARAMAGKIPQVEAELTQLNRDYDVIRRNYDQLVSRRESASMGEQMDASSQLADFRLVEPPRVSPKPASPSRRLLALAAVLATLLAGIGGAYAATVLRPTFHDTKSLTEFSGRPVLGSVPLLMSPALKSKHRAGVVKFGGLAALLLSMQFGWLIWIYLSSRI